MNRFRIKAWFLAFYCDMYQLVGKISTHLSKTLTGANYNTSVIKESISITYINRFVYLIIASIHSRFGS